MTRANLVALSYHETKFLLNPRVLFPSIINIGAAPHEAKNAFTEEHRMQIRFTEPIKMGTEIDKSSYACLLLIKLPKII